MRAVVVPTGVDRMSALTSARSGQGPFAAWRSMGERRVFDEERGMLGESQVMCLIW